MRQSPVADLADMFVLVCKFETISHPLNGWPHDHGPTNVGAMVTIIIGDLWGGVRQKHMHTDIHTHQ